MVLQNDVLAELQKLQHKSSIIQQVTASPTQKLYTCVSRLHDDVVDHISLY